MIEVKIKDDSYLFVEVAKDSFDFCNTFSGMIFYKKINKNYANTINKIFIYLRKDWASYKKTIIGDLMTLTKEQKTSIVECTNGFYVDYKKRKETGSEIFDYLLEDVNESFLSLLLANNINTNMNYLILKKDLVV